MVFVTYIEAISYKKKLREAHKDWDDANINQEFLLKFKEPKQFFVQRCQETMNHVLPECERFYPGLFHKRVIVYPESQGYHWCATFVFNAENIDHDAKVVTKYVRPSCFYPLVQEFTLYL